MGSYYSSLVAGMAASTSAVAQYVTFTNITIAVLTYYCVTAYWASLPEWIRGLSGSHLFYRKRARHEDANDALASPRAIISKLYEMMTLASQKTSSPLSEISYMTLMSAFYALIHLHREIRAHDPDYRDRCYDNFKEDDDVALDELQELKQYLEYADWAYEPSLTILTDHCKHAGLDLIKHDTATEPGRVGHYLAADHAAKLLIVGLKGTSTIADMLTDLVAIPKHHVCHFDKNKDDDHTPDRFYCHEGIWTAAMWMADCLQPFIEKMVVPLGYRVVITGHSLGAGTACLLGLELRSRIPALRTNTTDLRVVAYATPAIVSRQAAIGCAPFITSVVNNADVVCRASLANMINMNKLVVEVNSRLQNKGVHGQSYLSYDAYQKYYQNVTQIDDDFIMSTAELDEFFQSTHPDLVSAEDNDDELFVAGRCVVLWDKGPEDAHEIGGIVTTPDMKMLRQIELVPSLVEDHGTACYRHSITTLIKQLSTEDE